MECKIKMIIKNLFLAGEKLDEKRFFVFIVFFAVAGLNSNRKTNLTEKVKSIQVKEKSQYVSKYCFFTDYDGDSMVQTDEEESKKESSKTEIGEGIATLAKYIQFGADYVTI